MNDYTEEETLALSMISLLVIDLGYDREPRYGFAPIRHQLAWRAAARVLGEKSDSIVAECVEERTLQRGEE